MSVFKKATREKVKLRLAIEGVSGSGKTWTSLSIAKRFGKVAVIDTESGSASRYAGEFDFDVLEFEPPFHPKLLIKAINEAEKAGYDAVIVDSLSHFWFAQGGILDFVDEVAKKNAARGNRNSYTAWKEGTAIFNDMVDKIIRCKIHIICTMRSKAEYLQSEDEKGRKKIEKQGTAPIQRDGLEYEFDVVFDMDQQHTAVVSKKRISHLPDVIKEPGEELANLLFDWCQVGAEPVAVKSDLPKPPDPEPSEQTELFSSIDKDRQDKARAKFFALAGEIWPEKPDLKAYTYCGKILAADPTKGRASLTASTVDQVARAIKALDYELNKSKEAS